ncbi:MAG: histidine--tRNA ligase [Planctomycetes bacterium]|nr:histidine--tRNA ligase [Planctomycetota bacterium]
MSTIELQPVKGTRDFYPEDLRARTWLFAQWREVARQFGYEEYDVCVLEHVDLYIRKAGDEITSQLYEFKDKGDRHVALRPEMTPSLARLVLAKGAAMALPLRWFSLPQCFRYEQAQKGRKREHYQWNMDIIGLPGVAGEAELMAAQVAFLRRTGLNLEPGTPDIVWKVSNRQVIQFFLEGLGITGETFAAVCVVIDKRDKIGNEATVIELGKLGVGIEAADKIIDLLNTTGLEQAAAKVPADNPGLIALKELLALAEAAGFAHLIKIDLSVIRGLSYYTGTVWEVFDATGAMPRAIAGGGRYDKLMETFGGQPTPMVGFGFGDVVILEILSERGLLPTFSRGIDDVVFPMGPPEFAVATRVATFLRTQGRAVTVDYSGKRFKAVIERAEKDGAKRLLILGSNEVRDGVCVVRTLGGTERKEEKVPLKDLGVG